MNQPWKQKNGINFKIGKTVLCQKQLEFVFQDQFSTRLKITMEPNASSKSLFWGSTLFGTVSQSKRLFSSQSNLSTWTTCFVIPPQFRTRDQLATKPSESPGEARTHGFTKGNQIFWSACTQAYLQVPSVLLSWSLSNCLVFCLLMLLCLSSWFSLIVAQVEWNVQLLHVLLLQLFSTAASQPNWSSGLNGSPQFCIPAIPCGWMVTPTHR